MKNRLLQLSLLLVGVLLLASSAANAQKLLDYTIDKKYDQPYESIASTGSLLAQNIYGWSYWWLYEWDSRLGGFQFKYDDRLWNRFGIGGGGYIALFNGSMPFPYTCGQYSYPYTWIAYYFYTPHDIYNNMCANRPALYPMYAYYGTYYTATYPGRIYFQVRGTAPERVFIVEWNNVSPYDANSWPSSAYRNFQCWMHENGVVEYKYGPMYFPDNYSFNYYYYPPYWYGYTWFTVGFTGCDWVTSQDGLYSYYSYINIYARENGQEIVPHYSNKNYLPFYAHPAIRDIQAGFPTSADVAALRPGLVITLSAYPSITGTFPREGTIIKRGEVHTGENHPSAYFDRNNASMPEVYTKYKISGPLPTHNPLYKTIYTGTKLNPNDEIVYFSSQPVGKNQRRNIPYAKGLAARSSDGALDLLTNQSQIPGGEYMVEAEMVLYNPTTGGILITQKYKPQIFIIANDNDLAISELIAPKHKFDKKYPVNASPVPVQVRFVNVGVNNITRFTARVQIWHEDGTSEYDQTITWNNTNNPLVTGQSTTLIYSSFMPRRIGDYKLVVTSTLDNARDDDLTNNRFPRLGNEDFFFAVAHEFEGMVKSIERPKGEIYIDRPVRPIAIFQNNGVSDMSDIPVKCVIKNPSGQEIYEDNMTIQDIQAGQFNTRIAAFNTDFIPTVMGRHQICVSINYEDDPVTSNNTLCEYFDVVGAMEGTYTIGAANAGGARNFSTFQSAVDALFQRGVSNHVTFELTDASYNVGTKFGDLNYTPNVPALDLRSKIVGAGPNATITFKPSRVRGVFRGGVNINLLSDIGTGIIFGTSFEPNNSFAPVRDVHRSNYPKYATSSGHIIFDGGVNKSFRFKLDTRSNFRAPFYLADGAQNISVKNSLIENADPNNASFANSLPHFKYNQANQKFEYEPNTRTNGETYSAGVLLRSQPPMYLVNNDNPFHLDTLPNRHNNIADNEISGFGYGIVSIGAGVLQQVGSGMLNTYYNHNNTFAGNIISNISRAGIFLGYEENTSVLRNRIYNINGQSGMEAVGVEAGRPERDGFFGFNNIGLNINGNEISQVSSNTYIAGVKVLQSRFSLRDNIRGVQFYPYRAESMIVANNVVWGLTPLSAGADRAGIHVVTERKAMPGAPPYFVPKEDTYFSKNDKIVNNTVIITDDGGISNTGSVAGISLQQLEGAYYINNAVAFEDNSIATTSPVAAALFYHGIAPKEGGMTADRNAYWLGTDKGTVARFIETDRSGVMLEMGSRDEFGTLEQWALWTGQEENSVYGNFVQNLAYYGISPMKLRIKSEPDLPIGSILNNRGDVINWLTSDIDGRNRGSAGQRYDIGAFEFDGRMYIEDIELISIFDPGSFRAGSGLFNDAEYIMTYAPVNVRARVRNNSSLMHLNIPVNVKIYRETNVNGVFATTPVVEKTVNLNIEPTETVIADFKLNERQGSPFVPESYSDLRTLGYVPADHFATMTANVTPRYKIELSVASDQFNANNHISKVVRFYLQKSPVRMMLSAENSVADITKGAPTKEQIAGKLNFITIQDAMAKVGWKIDLNTEPPRYDYDLLERTAWEPRAVNYSIYRTLLWSDGDDKAMTRYERDDIRKYLVGGTDSEKKNLLIGSQEIVRSNQTIDRNFVNMFLRANDAPPSNPLGKGVSNDGNKIIGVTVARNAVLDINKTGYELVNTSGTYTDADPYSGLMKVFDGGEGVARAAFTYLDHSAAKSDSLMGIALTSLTRNVITLGSDWRHFANLELVLRGMIDFVETNGGAIIAAELINFDARQSGNKVEVNWSTASEINSARFVVERAQQTATGNTEFARIDELPGAGNSTTIRHYGPVLDRRVEYGNTYIYRLKMVDRDGQFEYSPERVVAMTGSLGNITMSEARPNPAADVAIIDYTLSADMDLTIELFDVSGKSIMTLVNGKMSAGAKELKIDVKNLASGSYNVVLRAGDITLTKNLNVVK